MVSAVVEEGIFRHVPALISLKHTLQLAEHAWAYDSMALVSPPTYANMLTLHRNDCSQEFKQQLQLWPQAESRASHQATENILHYIKLHHCTTCKRLPVRRVPASYS